MPDSLPHFVQLIFRRVTSTPDPDTCEKYRVTPPICAILLQKYALLLAESSRYTPPICITIRLPFVSRYFCRSIRVRGRWTTPKYSVALVRFSSVALWASNGSNGPGFQFGRFLWGRCFSEVRCCFFGGSQKGAIGKGPHQKVSNIFPHFSILFSSWSFFSSLFCSSSSSSSSSSSPPWSFLLLGFGGLWGAFFLFWGWFPGFWVRFLGSIF